MCLRVEESMCKVGCSVQDYVQRWEAEEASKRQKMAARQLEEVCVPAC